MFRIKKLTKLVVLACIAVGSTSALAATSAQKQVAIDSGLAYLAGQQQINGSWTGTGYSAADTSAALLAFIEQKSKPLGWNGQNYTANVTSGLNYLMTQATQVNVGVRTDGFNADQAGTGHGLYWGALSETTYISGLALSTLASAVKTGLVSGSTIISSPNTAVNGKTYGTVLQESVDMYLAGQTTVAGGVYRGGWHYYPSQGTADNSTAQWGAIGMLFAEQAGATVPQYTKDELKYWIDYIQNAGNGGSGYDNPNGGSAPISPSKTGGLLVEMAFAGYNGSGGTPNDTGGNSTEAGALAFINTNWQTTASTWLGNFGHPYAMWSVYKGLETTIGLDDGNGNPLNITNLHAQGANVIDPGSVWNWWEDYSQYLVDAQSTSGAWPGYYYWPQNLTTAWNINILNATEVGPGPGPGPGPNPAPEPATMALLAAGLIGLGAIRRRKAH